jgi:acylglycerol lipase
VVVVGLHGFNDYSNTFHLAAPWWAERGIATYAFDQRGFGRSPGRGVWAPDGVMIEDVRTCVDLVRRRHPKAIVSVAGVSMGGSVAIAAFASDKPPAADNVVLLAPGVWGWTAQPLPYKTSLWLTAHLIGDKVLRPPEWVLRNVRASDNIDELRRMGRDPHDLGRAVRHHVRPRRADGHGLAVDRARSPPRWAISTARATRSCRRIRPSRPSSG